MLTPEQEIYILNHAYVPEHIVVLMTSLSGGEPFLIDDYFCCCKDNWVIFIGYPLQHEFVFDEFEAILEKVKKKFRAGRISLIAPELSQRLDDTLPGKRLRHLLYAGYPISSNKQCG